MYIISKEIKFILKDENNCENLRCFVSILKIRKPSNNSFHCITSRVLNTLHFGKIIASNILVLCWHSCSFDLYSGCRQLDPLISAENHICVPGFQTAGKDLFLAGPAGQIQGWKASSLQRFMVLRTQFLTPLEKILLKCFISEQLKRDHALVV